MSKCVQCVCRDTLPRLICFSLGLMKKVNLAHVPAEQRQSPGGKYAKTIKEISVALGRDPNSLDLAKRHPFDLTLVRIPPGKSYSPYHSHGAASELYLVISGGGRDAEQAAT